LLLNVAAKATKSYHAPPTAASQSP